jgi:two-component system chemotaxis sensor kinase CheA
MSSDIEQNELNEILQEFYTEADESLDNLEQDLIRLEAMSEEGGTDAETVARIFRVLHTLKGGAGFLGLEKMAKLAHAGENLLDEIRNGKVAISKAVMDALLQTNDALKNLLAKQKNREDDSGVDNSALVATLEQLAGAAPQAPTPAAPAPIPAAPAPQPTATGSITLDDVMNDPALHPDKDKGDDIPKTAAAPAPAPVAAASTGGITLDDVLNDPALDPSKDKGDDIPKTAAAPAPAPVAVASTGGITLDDVLNDPALDPSKDKGEEAVATPTAGPQAGPLLPKQAPAPVEKRTETDRREGSDDRRTAPRREGEAGGETIRVETARLDSVMNLVGELVLARNTLLRQLSNNEVNKALMALDAGERIYAMTEQFSRVTQDLQMSVLSTRMQPIKKVFDKIPRQVRELKTKLGKEVNLIIEGEMTEVDRSLVDDLADPMVHMIRNALDHGLETPDEREMMGKHREGTLAVRAFYEGNNVVIQVQEDGKGIDPDRIRKVAVKKGIVTETAAAAMSDTEAVRLIMAPGFSTAEKITDVSGRGVGMDVVNTKIAKMQGSIDIRSELGVGTCFSIYLPLTLAIVNALIVGASSEGFAIPIGDISEVIKFKHDNIHHVNDTEVIELRGEPLPLFYLHKLTHHLKAPKPVRDDMTLDELEAVSSMPAEAKKSKPIKGFVVIVREGGSSMGLVVDELLGQEEVVVKSVASMFDYHHAIAGATITGDGKVHMILDVPFLIKDLSGVTARA